MVGLDPYDVQGSGDRGAVTTAPATLPNPVPNTNSTVDPYDVQGSGDKGAVVTPVASIPVAGKYTIQSGDTFYGIARKLGVNVNTILAANPGIDPTRLQIGQQVNTGSAYPVANVTPEQEAARRGQTTPLRNMEQAPNVPDIYDVQRSGGGTPGKPSSPAPSQQTPTSGDDGSVSGGYVGGAGGTVGGGGGTPGVPGASGGGETGGVTPEPFKGIDVGNGVFMTGDDIVGQVMTTKFEWDPAEDPNYQFAQKQAMSSILNVKNSMGMLWSSLTDNAMAYTTYDLQAKYYELAYDKYRDDRNFWMGLAELAYSREDRAWDENFAEIQFEAERQDRAWDEQFKLMEFQAQEEDRAFDREMARRADDRANTALNMQKQLQDQQIANQNKSVDMQYRAEKYGNQFGDYQDALNTWKQTGKASQEVVNIVNSFGGNIKYNQPYQSWDATVAMQYANQYFEAEKEAIKNIAFEVQNADYAIGSIYNFLKPEDPIDYNKTRPEELGSPGALANYRAAQEKFFETNSTTEAAKLRTDYTRNAAAVQDSMGYDLYVKLMDWVDNDFLPNYGRYKASTGSGFNAPTDITPEAS